MLGTPSDREGRLGVEVKVKREGRACLCRAMRGGEDLLRAAQRKRRFVESVHEDLGGDDVRTGTHQGHGEEDASGVIWAYDGREDREKGAVPRERARHHACVGGGD